MELLEDLDYREERGELKHQPIKKNIPLKIKSSSIINQNSSCLIDNQSNQNNKPVFSLSDEPQQQNNNSIKKPNFITPNTINSYKRSHFVSNLNWNFNTNTLSQKITDERMDYCMLCCLPILIYGRLIPCKHVMCIQCANNLGISQCLREKCQEKIERIEKVARGRIFVCNYDHESNKIVGVKEKYINQPELSQKNQCGRSYMSQRDLDAHIRHRHDPNLKINDYEIV